MAKTYTSGNYELYKFRVILSKCSSRDIAPLMCVRDMCGHACNDKSLVSCITGFQPITAWALGDWGSISVVFPDKIFQSDSPSLRQFKFSNPNFSIQGTKPLTHPTRSLSLSRARITWNALAQSYTWDLSSIKDELGQEKKALVKKLKSRRRRG